MASALPGPRRRPHPSGRADLLDRRQLLDEGGTVLPRVPLRLEGDQGGVQYPHQLDERLGHHTSSTSSACPSTHLRKGRRAVLPGNLEALLILPEHTYGVKEKTLIPQRFLPNKGRTTSM